MHILFPQSLFTSEKGQIRSTVQQENPPLLPFQLEHLISKPESMINSILAYLSTQETCLTTFSLLNFSFL